MHHIHVVDCRLSLAYSWHIQTTLIQSLYLQAREIRHTVPNLVNCLQRKQDGIHLGAYLGCELSSRLHDALAHLIIIPIGDIEGEIARPLLITFNIHDLTCCHLEDVQHPKQP
jgi:hypothetical protein